MFSFQPPGLDELTFQHPALGDIQRHADHVARLAFFLGRQHSRVFAQPDRAAARRNEPEIRQECGRIDSIALKVRQRQHLNRDPSQHRYANLAKNRGVPEVQCSGANPSSFVARGLAKTKFMGRKFNRPNDLRPGLSTRSDAEIAGTAELWAVAQAQPAPPEK